MALREDIKGQTESTELLVGALDHIEARGHLLQLVPDRAKRLKLMNALGQQGFVAWNSTLGKYELTKSGRQRLVASRQPAAKEVRAASG
jgi:hypothetical protein